jgi:aminomethyltransferase
MKTLAAHSRFATLNPKFIHFGDWEVPAYFSSIIDEHAVVREKAGLFDISHMGFFEVSGKDSIAFFSYVATNNVRTMKMREAQYSLLCNLKGGIIDDIFLYKQSDEHFFVIVNASNKEKDFAWLKSQSSNFDLCLRDLSSERAIFALQGPASGDIVKKIWGFDLATLDFHAFTHVECDDFSLLLATTGYTGEWGCELVVPRQKAEYVWDLMLKHGAHYGMQPIGFGARDTLRLEAGCLLYGNDMDETITPYEVGLGWVVKFDEHDFIGKDALSSQRKNGTIRKLVGFELLDRGIARHEYPVLKDGKVIGHVTSGSYCPTINKNVGFALIESECARIDETIFIEVRNKPLKAQIIKKPFYKRDRAQSAKKCGTV